MTRVLCHVLNNLLKHDLVPSLNLLGIEFTVITKAVTPERGFCHCTPAGWPLRFPKSGKSDAQFLVVGNSVRAVPSIEFKEKLSLFCVCLTCRTSALLPTVNITSLILAGILSRLQCKLSLCAAVEQITKSYYTFVTISN